MTCKGTSRALPGAAGPSRGSIPRRANVRRRHAGLAGPLAASAVRISVLATWYTHTTRPARTVPHLSIRLSHGDPRPIYVQIMDEIRRAIVVGTLRPDEALPSVRQLAGELRAASTRWSRAGTA